MISAFCGGEEGPSNTDSATEDLHSPLLNTSRISKQNGEECARIYFDAQPPFERFRLVRISQLRKREKPVTHGRR